MQHGVVALAAALAITLGACPSDDGELRLDEACLDEGRCECLRSSDCDAGLTCVDGACRDLRPDVARPDVVFDTDGATATSPTDVTTDVGPEPGRLGWPCDDDEQCNSGRCIRYGDARVCTESCVATCPAGWGCKGLATALTIDFFCVPADEHLCEPCLGDRSCVGRDGATNLCVALDDGPVCAIACGSDGACPSGYACRDVTSVDGVAARQCVPEGGACQCGPDATGIAIPCQLDNAFGTCFGTRPCQPGGTVGACDAQTPAPETCDGRDDDCNGFTDDVLPTPCQRDNELGTCRGELRCLPGTGAVCTAAEPVAEACNNLDDDCDGATDEDFVNELDQVATLEHCGRCGESCVGRFANVDEVRCDDAGATPTCAIVSCAPGFLLDVGGTCVRPIDRLCEPCTADASCGGASDRCVVDPVDGRGFCARDCAPGNVYGGDCPAGYTCEDVGGGALQCVPLTGSCDCSAANAGQIRPCSTTTEAGTCFGVATCDAEAGWGGCTARTATSESCNGLDDDCDGLADDGLGGAVCVRDNDFGSCPGVQICDGGAGRLVCVARDAAAEVCNGLDDDCDRQVDEDFAVVVRDEAGQPVGLKYMLSDAHCGACGFACTAVAPATQVGCDGAGLEPFCRILACADGFYVDPSGRVCLPVPSGNLCLPCEGDADCQGPNDRCLGGDYGGHCGRDCGPGNIYGDCPAGFGCVDGQCRRDSGDCACDADGELRSCVATNEAGTCAGVETCTTSGPAAGWSACSAPAPAAEVCNGQDDDCDGLVDQADPGVDASGLAGYPLCENVSSACGGRWTCGDDGAGFTWRCSARTPESEICNGRDDDCDGLVDDGFVDGDGAYRLVAHCGQCGLDCRGAIADLAAGDGAVGCQDVDGRPTCVPLACAPGFVPFPVGAPRVCLPLEATSCRPCQVDGDCGLGGDQCVAVGRDDGAYCAQRCDAAAPYPGCTGVIGDAGCCPSGFACALVEGAALCQPDSGSCQCTADAAGARRVCQATGNGGLTTCFGTETCAEDGGHYGWSTCDLSANVEVCDALDNDCDGQTDEGFQAGGVYALEAHCGECGRSCALAFDVATQHAAGACEVLASPPRCVLGACVGDATHDYVDLDGAEGNGCECAVLRGGPPDAPDVLAQIPTVGAPMLDSDCDGVDGDRETAVFVRAGAAGGDGSYEAPFGTIQAAIDAFAAGRSAILVATGVYPEAIVLRAGVSLFGGYSADFLRRDIVLYPTVIAPDVADLGGARVGGVNARGIAEATTLAGFTVRGVDPTTRGASTYALYVADSTAALVITNNVIVGGRAAPGDLGGDGAPGGGGGNGAPGLQSRECADSGCSGGTESQAGGVGGANASCAAAAGCLGMESEAGENPQVKDAPAVGCAYNRGGSKGNYNGGAAALCKYDFSPGGNNVGDGGNDGTQGEDGSAGVGCGDADGQIVSDLWAPAAGTIGGVGTAGTGGMGGSAGGWADNSKAATCTAPAPGANFGDLGASGGGGGAGGCGGTGGAPGAPGGASFAVFVARRGASSPVVQHNDIARGQGGAGGQGGSGGTGGKGGTGGTGGVAIWPAWGAGTAGPGGRGGDGGDGGGGGGGCGGPAYGIAGPGAPTSTYGTGNAFVVLDAVATGGAGGAGGLSAGAGAGSAGVAGQSANVKAW
ncbi:MAG: hypothetical protein IT385_30985 [Deltaproteobacteria bacterium]|nr:hypothetical protein [Deltaproteobacteria bacterium]